MESKQRAAYLPNGLPRAIGSFLRDDATVGCDIAIVDLVLRCTVQLCDMTSEVDGSIRPSHLASRAEEE